MEVTSNTIIPRSWSVHGWQIGYGHSHSPHDRPYCTSPHIEHSKTFTKHTSPLLTRWIFLCVLIFLVQVSQSSIQQTNIEKEINFAPQLAVFWFSSQEKPTLKNWLQIWKRMTLKVGQPSELLTFSDVNYCTSLTLSLPRVINFKCPLQPNQECYITQYEERGFL